MSSNLLKPAASGADQIQHSAGKLGGILGGMALGCIAGAALVAAPFVTGIAAAACFAGTVAATGISMGMLAEGLEQVGVLFNTNLVTGNINLFCSDNVLIGLRPAARAGLEDYANCSGLSFIFHVDYPTTFIAEGSSTVFINGLCAARQGDLLQCGASIKDGNDTVLIGGETARVLDVDITNVDRFEHFLVGVTAVSGVILMAPVMVSSTLNYAICSITIASSFVLFPIIDAAFKDYCDENLGEGWYNIISGGMGLVFVCSSVVMSSLRTKMHINKSLNNLFESTSKTISKKKIKNINSKRKLQKKQLINQTKEKIHKHIIKYQKNNNWLIKQMKKLESLKKIIIKISPKKQFQKKKTIMLNLEKMIMILRYFLKPSIFQKRRL
ncbi:type IV secretion protein Rhs [Candidatus Magnetomorum sp. HK-1]|nr:type IV secretion protein Rhs [Candidatus Magnetomorum sp. HK-1]